MLHYCDTSAAMSTLARDVTRLACARCSRHFGRIGADDARRPIIPPASSAPAASRYWPRCAALRLPSALSPASLRLRSRSCRHRQRLAVGIAHDLAAGHLFGGPGRGETARRHCGIMVAIGCAGVRGRPRQAGVLAGPAGGCRRSTAREPPRLLGGRSGCQYLIIRIILMISMYHGGCGGSPRVGRA
jgi:hypothetical protein